MRLRFSRYYRAIPPIRAAVHMWRERPGQARCLPRVDQIGQRLLPRMASAIAVRSAVLHTSWKSVLISHLRRPGR